MGVCGSKESRDEIFSRKRSGSHEEYRCHSHGKDATNPMLKSFNPKPPSSTSILSTRSQGTNSSSSSGTIMASKASAAYNPESHAYKSNSKYDDKEWKKEVLYPYL